MMIGMGDIYNGPELQGSAISQYLKATWKANKFICGERKEGESPAVIVVWIVPGSLGEVNFTGQRVTLFSKKKKLLQIEAEVPREVVDAGGSIEFVIDALHKACATAAEVFARKGPEPFDLAKADAMIEKVKEYLIDWEQKGRPWLGKPLSKRLSVNNLREGTTVSKLKQLLSPFGTVLSAEIIQDGHGIVEMATAEEAQAAIVNLNRTELDGKRLTVHRMPMPGSCPGVVDHRVLTTEQEEKKIPRNEGI